MATKKFSMLKPEKWSFDTPEFENILLAIGSLLSKRPAKMFRNMKTSGAISLVKQNLVLQFTNILIVILRQPKMTDFEIGHGVQ